MAGIDRRGWGGSNKIFGKPPPSIPASNELKFNKSIMFFKIFECYSVIQEMSDVFNVGGFIPPSGKILRV